MPSSRGRAGRGGASASSRKLTSPYVGVSLANSRVWKAEICVKGHTTYLGRFADDRDAARAYNAFIRAHGGLGGRRLNVIRGPGIVLGLERDDARRVRRSVLQFFVFARLFCCLQKICSYILLFAIYSSSTTHGATTCGAFDAAKAPRPLHGAVRGTSGGGTTAAS